MVEIRLILVISLLLLLPGWAILVASGLWKRYEAVQRWFLAIGISIAFYPLLYYFSRFLLPGMRIGENKLWLLLFICLALTIFGMRKNLKDLLALGNKGWLAFLILLVTLFTRLWLAYQHPYPGWTDSLHHSLLTQLTAQNGQLPYTLAPFAVSDLSQYHLGLYALSAPVQLLADVPAHTAVLWMSQVLNGLCGIGLFLYLDRRIGSVAGLVGMAIVGLFSFQPAWYFNPGRFTQVSAQAILLVAAMVAVDAMQNWSDKKAQHKVQDFLHVLLAGMLIAGVFLLHFRVAGYLLPLLVILVLAHLWKGIRQKQSFGRTVLSVLLIAFVSLVLILPALIPAMRVYFADRVGAIPGPGIDSPTSYYAYDMQWFWVTVSSKLMLGLAVGGAIAGLFGKKRQEVLFILLWVLLLIAEGMAYRTGNMLLAFTNISAILIMLYMPIGLLIGMLAEQLVGYVPQGLHIKAELSLLGLMLVGAIYPAYQRATVYEDYRQFFTAADEKAMNWIQQNTTHDSLFAVNTQPFTKGLPLGVDGGYWIPYFTGRQTTTGTMLASLGDDLAEVQVLSRVVLGLYEDPTNLEGACEVGVDYLYIGAKWPYTGNNFDASSLLASGQAALVYDEDGVNILEVCR